MVGSPPHIKRGAHPISARHSAARSALASVTHRFTLLSLHGALPCAAAAIDNGEQLARLVAILKRR